jgi:hypothetical protein
LTRARLGGGVWDSRHATINPREDGQATPRTLRDTIAWIYDLLDEAEFT